METSELFLTLALSLGLGLLVGLQRERTSHRLAGIRTFGLISLLGTLAALAAPTMGGWVVAAGLLAIAAVVVSRNMISLRQGDKISPGVTSEIAILAMYLVGAYAAIGPRGVTVAVGASVAILLYAKPVLHGFVQKLGDADVRAIMQFALISLVILPAVPDRTFGPYSVLNPRNIWLMVVLVVGMSLAGYVAYKLFGKGAGLALGGVLGGLISSTATTVSYARRAAEDQASARAAAAVIIIAGTVVYGRLLVEIAVTAPEFLKVAAPPICTLAGVSITLATVCWLSARNQAGDLGEQSNPTQLKSALFFAGLYALVLLAVAAAKENLGHSGLYSVAAVSGLTDMDAITLSVSRMVSETDGQRLDASVGWRAIVIAAMSNMVFKGITAAALGGRALAGRIGVCFGIKLVAAGVVLAVW